VFFPVSEKYKILVDEMRYCEIEQHFWAYGLLSFGGGDDDLHEGDVVLYGFEDGLVEIDAVCEDSQWLITELRL
jgi:hypothetical protein